MGNILTRHQADRIEEVDIMNSNAYCYPPKVGNYFTSHFIMGGERFETFQPESYLFGESMDLNFLGGRPTPFPYSAPMPHEPTRTLRALTNIRKESLRLIKVMKNENEQTKEKDVVSVSENTVTTDEDAIPDVAIVSGGLANSKLSIPPIMTITEEKEKAIASPFEYNIEFTFDSDVRCAITIHYFCSEEITSNGITYTPRDTLMSSETYYYKRGSNQQFTQSTHLFTPALFSDEELVYKAINDHGEFDTTALLPVVIQCVAQEGDDPRQSHSLIAIVERNQDNSYSIKPLKQKLFVDGLCYLLQEIYGIENKNAIVKQDNHANEEEIDDNSSECVICMSDSRDTLILPCRHLCLCYGCAESLRYQANNCPICRAPFRALLQIRAVRKISSSMTPTVMNHQHTHSSTPPIPHHHQLMSSNSNSDLIDIPPGYEPIPLIEALNGPLHHQSVISHTMFPYKVSGDANSIETPTTNLKKYYKNERSKKPFVATAQSVTADASSAGLNLNAAVNATPGLAKARPLISPSTPEVVLSSLPLSPEKEIVGVNVETSNSSNPTSTAINDVKERDRWRSKAGSKSHKIVLTADDNGSSSSSSSSATNENISMQERQRLLSNDKDHDEMDYMEDGIGKVNRNEIDEDCDLPFTLTPASPPSLMKDSTPGNSSPLSIGVSSGSYAMISLRDGLDEQTVMDDALIDDLVSLANNNHSANNALISGIHRLEDDDGSDYFTPDDPPQGGVSFSAENANSSSQLVDQGTDTSLDTPMAEHKISEKSVKEKDKLKSNVKKNLHVKLAETESTDDDLSPGEI